MEPIMLRHGFALALILSSAQAQTRPTRTAWVLARDQKGRPVQDLAKKEWKITAGGKTVELLRAETPEETGTLCHSWALVFEPIREPAYRITAFQAAAQFLVNLPEGDRILIAARTKTGLTQLTPGLTTDRLAWAKALEELPEKLCSVFEGTAGARDAALDDLKVPMATPPQQEAFVASLKAFLAGLPKTVPASPYGKPEPKGVRPIERLQFGSQTAVRAGLKVVSAEMDSLAHLLETLGKLPAPSHCIVFSRNDADDYTHPSVRASMKGGFQRSQGDEGGPQESAELAFREMTLSQATVRQAAVRAGITLHSIAGSGGQFFGNLGPTAEATGGIALSFDGALPVRLGQSLQTYGSRYRLTWEEGGEASASPQALSISTSREGISLVVPRER